MMTFISARKTELSMSAHLIYPHNMYIEHANNKSRFIRVLLK